MNTYVMLWNWTEKGAGNLAQSPDRAEAFLAAARKLGAKVETFYWTVGPYDGLAIFQAPDDETASALSLSTGKLGNIRTCTMRGYDTNEFRKIVAKFG